jgi:hypothetical protein
LVDSPEGIAGVLCCPICRQWGMIKSSELANDSLYNDNGLLELPCPNGGSDFCTIMFSDDDVQIIDMMPDKIIKTNTPFINLGEEAYQ